MRHKKDTFKVGRSGEHRKALLANQTCSLIYSGEIKTTLAKAKQTRRVAEKMVTLAKRGTLHSRRLARSRLRDPEAVRILFDELVEKFKGRNGGYTRILKMGQREGDGAEMCLLKWVSEPNKQTTEKKEEAQNSQK